MLYEFKKAEKKQDLIDLACCEFAETGSCLNDEVTKEKVKEKMAETSSALLDLILSGELSFNDIQAAREEYEGLVNDAIESAVKDIAFEDEMERLGL